MTVTEHHEGTIDHEHGPCAAGDVRDLALDAIEPDPGQPRRAFDDAKLRSLAASIAKYGLLQEPGVVPLPASGEGEPRYRLVWGERRWRASRLAGLSKIRCKVLPVGDDTAVEQLRTKEKQWAENMEREGLSPIEEAMAIQDAMDLERKLDANTALGDLVEKVGAARGLSGMVARNLVALLKTPRCLQSAVLARSVGREVAFELARHWNKMLADHDLHGAAKREIQFRNLVEAWARDRGADLDTHAMAAYAAETFQDPDVVKATCRKAEEAQRKLVERFAGTPAQQPNRRATSWNGSSAACSRNSPRKLRSLLVQREMRRRLAAPPHRGKSRAGRVRALFSLPQFDLDDARPYDRVLRVGDRIERGARDPRRPAPGLGNTRTGTRCPRSSTLGQTPYTTSADASSKAVYIAFMGSAARRLNTAIHDSCSVLRLSATRLTRTSLTAWGCPCAKLLRRSCTL
jgi:ParB family chromosome partitioning protein